MFRLTTQNKNLDTRRILSIDKFEGNIIILNEDDIMYYEDNNFDRHLHSVKVEMVMVPKKLEEVFKKTRAYNRVLLQVDPENFRVIYY